MIFARLLEYPGTEKVLHVLKNGFGEVEWGDQGTEKDPDAYFWVQRDGAKVAVDNLTSLEFQVKCTTTANSLVADVINALSQNFKVEVFDEPEPEAHEDCA